MKISIMVGILTLALAISPLVGCSQVVKEVEPAPTTEQPAIEAESEQPVIVPESTNAEPAMVEEVISPVTKGPAEELALEAADIGPEWVRLYMEVKYDGKWTNQTLHNTYIKNELEYTEQVIEKIRVYPDAEEAILDNELNKERVRILHWEEHLEGLPEEGWEAEREILEARIKKAASDFWDEAYQRDNRMVLRKDNIIVVFESLRIIRRCDSLTGSYTPILDSQLTPEQAQWLDREHYATNLLNSLAEKAGDKISAEEPFE